jgi:hypothetical protein
MCLRVIRVKRGGHKTPFDETCWDVVEYQWVMLSGVRRWPRVCGEPTHVGFLAGLPAIPYQKHRVLSAWKSLIVLWCEVPCDVCLRRPACQGCPALGWGGLPRPQIMSPRMARHSHGMLDFIKKKWVRSCSQLALAAVAMFVKKGGGRAMRVVAPPVIFSKATPYHGVVQSEPAEDDGAR